MMYRIQDWFIHLLILSTVYKHDKQKTIVYKSDQFKMEKVTKMRPLTVITDLNGDLSFFLLILFQYMSAL